MKNKQQKQKLSHSVHSRLKIAFEMYERGQVEQAEVIYTKILQSHEQNFEALQMLATIALQKNNVTLAVELFNRAIAVKSDCVEVFYNRGIALFYLGRNEAALESYNQALMIKPDYAEALNNRGIVLESLARHEEALKSYNHALTFNPVNAKTYYNRGITLRKLKRHTEALESYHQALAINPYYPEALYNRGMVFADLKDHEKALESYHQAQCLNPDYAQAHWNEGLCRLLLGDFELGWQKYEWRWKNEFFKPELRNFQQSLWLGKENIENKTLLLHSEQGLGDTIQFCRYVKKVKELGVKVIVEVQAPLKTLLQNLEGVSIILSKGEALPDFDYHCPLMSLPLVFKTNIHNIESVKYLKSDSAKTEIWKSKLNLTQKLKVGIVWRGNAKHQNDLNRSIPLEKFTVLLANVNADFYCLQKELSSTEESILTQTNIPFLGNELNDFSDTAALIELMDVIISVDTSVAHLAGAMGKKVWILLAFNSDWRWLLDRNDSPWYESAKLFRQDETQDWANVMTVVNHELKKLYE